MLGVKTLMAALIVLLVQRAVNLRCILCGTVRSGLMVFYQRGRGVMESSDRAECCCGGTVIAGLSQRNQNRHRGSMFEEPEEPREASDSFSDSDN